MCPILWHILTDLKWKTFNDWFKVQNRAVTLALWVVKWEIIQKTRYAVRDLLDKEMNFLWNGSTTLILWSKPCTINLRHKIYGLLCSVKFKNKLDTFFSKDILRTHAYPYLARRYSLFLCILNDLLTEKLYLIDKFAKKSRIFFWRCFVYLQSAKQVSNIEFMTKSLNDSSNLRRSYAQNFTVWVSRWIKR